MVTGGDRLPWRLRLPAIRSFVDDMTTMTPPCTRLLEKLNTHLRCARRKIKPSKCRSLSIVKGEAVGGRWSFRGNIDNLGLPRPMRLCTRFLIRRYTS